MSIPVNGVKVVIKYYGMIEAIEDTVLDYGRYAQVKMKPCNPDATSYKTFRFRLPDDPDEKPKTNSKWIRFVTSYNKLNKKQIATTDEMNGIWVCIEETPKSFEPSDGSGTTEYMEPLVAEIFLTEEAAMTAWKSHQAAIVKKVAASAENPVPFDEPKPIVIPVPEAIAVVLKTMLGTVGGDKEKLWALAQSMGFTKMQVFAAVD